MNSLNVTSTVESSTVYFHRSLKRFGIGYMAILIILGFIGNSISSYVFIRSKLKRLSCSSYLIALSLSDNGYLICLSMIWLENLHLYIFHNNGICQIAVYLTTVFSSLSVW
ncbi:unnamed protein product [Adineta steineri]|nr:unnamed protein product [Adineta steineri]